MAKKQTQKNKWKFSSTSLVPKTTPLLNRAQVTPTLYYTPEVWHKMWYIIKKAPLEVGWLGLVEKIDEDDYIVTEIFVPEQEVHGTETDISGEAVAELALELIDKGIDTTKLIYWGHSHVNMGVSPSGQDEKQVAEYLNNCPLFIRGIYNKKGESKVDIYDVEQQVIHQAVENPVYLNDLQESEYEALDELLKTKVKKKVYTKINTRPKQTWGNTQQSQTPCGGAPKTANQNLLAKAEEHPLMGTLDEEIDDYVTDEELYTPEELAVLAEPFFFEE